MEDTGGGRGRDGLGQVIVRPYRWKYSDYVLTIYEVLPKYFLGAERERSTNLTRKFMMMMIEMDYSMLEPQTKRPCDRNPDSSDVCYVR